MRFHRGRCLRLSKSIAMLRLTHDHGNLIGGKPGNRIPQFKQTNEQNKINLNIYAMIIVSLTVLNGRGAILSSQTWPY